MFKIKFCKKKILEDDEADDKKFEKYYKHRKEKLLKDKYPDGTTLPPLSSPLLENKTLKEHNEKLKELKKVKEEEDKAKAEAEKER